MPSGRTQLVYNNDSLSLGTLGGDTAITDATRIDSSREQGCVIDKMLAYSHLQAKTAGEGPLLAGFCIELSASEIAEVFSADPQRYNDPNSTEAANRRLLVVWSYGAGPTDIPGPTHGTPPIYEWRDVRFPSWVIAEGEDLSYFVYNTQGTALTTGTVMDWGFLAITKWETD